MRLAHPLGAARQVLRHDARRHLVAAGRQHRHRAGGDDGRALVLRGVLLVGRVLRRVIPVVGPGDEHHRRNPVLHVGHVIARAVVLVDLDVERVVAAVGRLDRQARRVAVGAEAHALARDLRDELHHALADVVQERRERVGRALQNPVAARRRQADAFHVEVQVGDDALGDVRVGGEPGVGAADLRAPRGSGSCASASAASLPRRA